MPCSEACARIRMERAEFGARDWRGAGRQACNVGFRADAFGVVAHVAVEAHRSLLQRETCDFHRCLPFLCAGDWTPHEGSGYLVGPAHAGNLDGSVSLKTRRLESRRCRLTAGSTLASADLQRWVAWIFDQPVPEPSLYWNAEALGPIK